MCEKYSQDSQERLHREYISRRKLVFAIYRCYIKTSVDKAWLLKIVDANQFISGKSRNKVVTNKS